MGAREANRLAGLAAELREQVPPQFLPKENAKLRGEFAVADLPAAPDDPETPNSDTQEFSFEAEPVVTVMPEPVLAAANEDTGLELESEEPEQAEPEINVVDTPGASDIHEQQQYVSAVHEEADEQSRRRASQAQDAAADGKDIEGSVNGHIVSGMWANARQDESAEKKREKENEKFTQSMLKKILEDRIKWLDAQITYWKEQERVWEDRGDAIAEAIARKNRGEEIETDENGLPRDRRLREALDAYEKKYGRRLDVNDKDDLLRLQRFANDETALARQQVGRYERERAERLEQVRELESGGMTPEKQQEIWEQRRTLEGQKELGEIAWLSRENKELNRAIDAQTAQTEEAKQVSEIQLADQSVFSQESGLVEDGSEDLFETEGTSVAKAIDPLGSKQDSLRPGFAFAASGENTAAPEEPGQRLAAAPASALARSV